LARTPSYVWRDGSICFELESFDADVLQEARARERGEIESSWKGGGLDRDKVREVEPLTRSLELTAHQVRRFSLLILSCVMALPLSFLNIPWIISPG